MKRRQNLHITRNKYLLPFLSVLNECQITKLGNKYAANCNYCFRIIIVNIFNFAAISFERFFRISCSNPFGKRNLCGKNLQSYSSLLGNEFCSTALDFVNILTAPCKSYFGKVRNRTFWNIKCKQRLEHYILLQKSYKAYYCRFSGDCFLAISVEMEET